MNLTKFLNESNDIEGLGPPTHKQIACAEIFLEIPRLHIVDIVTLVNVFQPDAELRTRKSMNVRVGNHIAPCGGKQIAIMLEGILYIEDPFKFYCAYEDLHPFTDCNGRSGRLIWLHKAPVVTESSFLKTFHYQTLRA